MADHSNSPLNADATSERYLRELSSLNYRFVRLLCAGEDTPGHPVLSATLRASLNALPEHSQRRLASCPCSLFDLDFANQPVWTDILMAPARTDAEAPPAVAQFTLAAIIFAQQLCYRNADLGALLLGIGRPVATLLRQVSIGQLMDRIDGEAAVLRVRLVTDPRFWPDLVNYVRDGTPQQYLAAQTTALQLMAAHGASWSS